MDAVHRGLKPHECDQPQCNKAFSQKSDLTKHKKIAHEKAFLKAFACPKCDRLVSSKQQLQIHVKTVHEGIKYPCGICDKTFTEKGNLRKHVKAVHN